MPFTVQCHCCHAEFDEPSIEASGPLRLPNHLRPDDATPCPGSDEVARFFKPKAPEEAFSWAPAYRN